MYIAEQNYTAVERRREALWLRVASGSNTFDRRAYARRRYFYSVSGIHGPRERTRVRRWLAREWITLASPRLASPCTVRVSRRRERRRYASRVCVCGAPGSRRLLLRRARVCVCACVCAPNQTSASQSRKKRNGQGTNVSLTASKISERRDFTDRNRSSSACLLRSCYASPLWSLYRHRCILYL